MEGGFGFGESGGVLGVWVRREGCLGAVVVFTT